MKIINEFTEITIQLEHSRNPSTMSIDDLYWCFETKIEFYKNYISQPVLTIDSASFFFFLSGFKDVIDSISNEEPGEYIINDQEGSFVLTVNSDGDSVLLNKNYPSQSFDVSLHEFLTAAYQWVEEAKKNIENLFPGLGENPEYRNLEI